MNDLTFTIRQLVKNPGFTAGAVITLGSGGRIPCGCRSKSMSNRRRDAGPPRDSPGLSGRTRLWNSRAVAPAAGRGAPDFRGVCGSFHARTDGCAQASFDIGPKTLLNPWGSQVALELIARSFPELLRSLFAFDLDFIQQFLQRGTRTRVVNDPLPYRVAVQFRYQSGQVLRQPLPLRGRQRTDGCLDFLNRAHVATIGCHSRAGKFRMCHPEKN